MNPAAGRLRDIQTAEQATFHAGHSVQGFELTDVYFPITGVSGGQKLGAV